MLCISRKEECSSTVGFHERQYFFGKAGCHGRPGHCSKLSMWYFNVVGRHLDSWSVPGKLYTELPLWKCCSVFSVNEETRMRGDSGWHSILVEASTDASSRRYEMRSRERMNGDHLCLSLYSLLSLLSSESRYRHRRRRHRWSRRPRWPLIASSTRPLRSSASCDISPGGF